jgi:hypothetical protein
MLKKSQLSIILMLIFAGIANAQEDDSIIGTISVAFQPIQVSGELQGCTLVYNAVQNDFAYLKGSPIVSAGHLLFTQRNGNLIFGFKLGVKSLNGDNPFVRPNFAYLQTASFSTSKIKVLSVDGDIGFKFFAYSLDEQVLGLYTEMLESGKITIGFNRKKGGMDVLVPIDLYVTDVEAQGSKFIRKRSNEQLQKFTECSMVLMQQVAESPAAGK